MKQFVAQGHKEFQRRTAGLVIHSQKSHELEVIQDGEDDNDEVYAIYSFPPSYMIILIISIYYYDYISSYKK